MILLINEEINQFITSSDGLSPYNPTAGLSEVFTEPKIRPKPVVNRKEAPNNQKRASQPRIPSNGFRGVRLEYDTRNPRQRKTRPRIFLEGVFGHRVA